MKNVKNNTHSPHILIIINCSNFDRSVPINKIIKLLSTLFFAYLFKWTKGHEMTTSWVIKNQRSACHGFIIVQRFHSNKPSHKITVFTSAKIIGCWLHDYNHHVQLKVVSFT